MHGGAGMLYLQPQVDMEKDENCWGLARVLEQGESPPMGTISTFNEAR